VKARVGMQIRAGAISRRPCKRNQTAASTFIANWSLCLSGWTKVKMQKSEPDRGILPRSFAKRVCWVLKDIMRWRSTLSLDL